MRGRKPEPAPLAAHNRASSNQENKPGSAKSGWNTSTRPAARVEPAGNARKQAPATAGIKRAQQENVENAKSTKQGPAKGLTAGPRASSAATAAVKPSGLPQRPAPVRQPLTDRGNVAAPTRTNSGGGSAPASKVRSTSQYHCQRPMQDSFGRSMPSTCSVQPNISLLCFPG